MDDAHTGLLAHYFLLLHYYNYCNYNHSYNYYSLLTVHQPQEGLGSFLYISTYFVNVEVTERRCVDLFVFQLAISSLTLLLITFRFTGKRGKVTEERPIEGNDKWSFLCLNPLFCHYHAL